MYRGNAWDESLTENGVRKDAYSRQTYARDIYQQSGNIFLYSQYDKWYPHD